MTWRHVDAIIEGRLYLGNLAAAVSSRSLTERRISHILSVCDEPIPADNPQSGIIHLRIRVPNCNHADLVIHLPNACRFIDNALQSGGVVLVHCDQGISRSATVVAAYLMYSRRLSVTRALDIVRRAREQTWILPGFFEQLSIFADCQYRPYPGCGIYDMWKSQIERKLKEGGFY